MRSPLRAFAVAAVLTAAGLAPASTARADPGAPIGGPELGSHGLILHKGATTQPIPAAVLAPGWIVADLDSGAVLAAKDPHGLYRPASTMKTLTSTALLPQEPEGTVYTGTHAEATVDGTRVGIEAGVTYTRKQILEGMLLPSGNDAAEAFAAAYPGGRAAALAQMNSFAAHLQADDTTAKTPSGLDADGQFSSPYDLALIARALLADPVLSQVVAERRSTFPCSHGPSCKHGTFQIQNHNHVVTTLKDAIGVKNGGTALAHVVVVGAINRGGHRYVAVVMKADFDPFSQTIDLLNWAARNAATVQPVGQLVDPLPVDTAAPAVPLTRQQKVATKLARATTSGSSSHWKRNLLIGTALIAGAGAWLRRRGQVDPARPADSVSPAPWARVSAVITPDAPPAPAEPFDQDAPAGSSVRVRRNVD